MALITLGGGVASISGSIGGTTFSRNRGGPYMRTRAVPVNPNSPAQAAVRSFMAQLTALWSDTLTQAQRDLWDTYALNVLLPNALGEPRNVGGIGMYIRSNVPRLQSSLDRVDAAPTIFNLGDFTAPSAASITAPGDLSIAFEETDDWVTEDGAALIIYSSRGNNASINFFKGPFRYAAAIPGAVVPVTSPDLVASPFPFVATQKVFLRARVTRADGRLSAETYFRGVSV